MVVWRRRADRVNAIMPVVMSCAALAVIAARLRIVGVGRSADEDAFAHLWQLLIALQVPLIALFALRSLPREPRHASAILAVQVGMLVVACAPVFILHW